MKYFLAIALTFILTTCTIQPWKRPKCAFIYSKKTILYEYSFAKCDKLKHNLDDKDFFEDLKK